MTDSRPDEMDRMITAAAELIGKARRVAAFTGAGLSTESGIPDYRSPGGVWDKYEIVYYDDFVADKEARKKYWLRSRAGYPLIRDARPNPAHLALAQMERLGKLSAIVTQNIDYLHQRAGNDPSKVVELHGTVAHASCLHCLRTYDRQAIQEQLERMADIEPPLCEICGGLIKDATVSFGQAMPEDALRAAENIARSCDLMLVLGSSLVVYPAASIPLIARESGAKLIIINLGKTSLDGSAVLIEAKVGAVLPRIVDRWRQGGSFNLS